MKKIFHLILTIFFINIFFGCASSNISSPNYFEKELELVNGNLVHFYFFKNELNLWNNFKNFLNKELDISISDSSINKIKKSSWEVDKKFDENLKSYMIQNNYQFGIASISESSDKTTLIINQCINNIGYGKIWSFSKPTKVDVKTDIPWWMFL